MTIDVAVAGSAPGAVITLRAMVEDAMARRLTREQALATLETARFEHPEHEDLILDVMDMFEGWCAPHLAL